MKKVIASMMVLAMPAFAFAQSLQLGSGDQNLGGLVGLFKNVLTVATQLLIAAAVVWFLFGVFKFVMSAGEAEKREEGRSQIITGVIGIAVMVSVWGLVGWVTGTFNATSNQALPAPSLGL